jgi:hypothetical protein
LEGEGERKTQVAKVDASCNSICFLKFVAHKMNSEMVKFGIVMLTGREKTDMTDADVTVG